MIPLTPMQLGLVAESNGADRPWVDVEQVVVHLDDEEVDLDHLRAAWAHVQARHELLRASVAWADADVPHLLVHDAAPIDVEVVADGIDLDGWLDADRRRGVDLDRAPAMRLALLAAGPRRSTLVWTFHHALLDGRSFTIVLEEVFDAYDRLRAGETVPPPAPGPRFADHVAAALDVDRAAAEAWFGDVLAGADVSSPPPLAGLPAPAVPPSGGAGRHRQVEARVSSATADRLREVAARSDATLAGAVLAGWAVVLGGISGRDDVVYGSTRSGRHTTADAADLVGCLITTVPVRARPAPERTVDELLAGIRTQQVGVRPFEHTSPADIGRWAGVPAGAAPYDTCVVFERRLVDRHLRAKGGPWARRRVRVLEETGLPVVLAAYEDDGLLLCLEYDADRYAGTAIADLAARLVAVLGAMAAASPTTTVADLGFLGPADTARLLDELSPPAAPVEPVSVAERFERQVDLRPGAAALSVAGGPSTTYAELDAAANRLAHHLLDAGVEPGDLVAVALPRSPGFVVALLAVLKAGAAFLPLDPAYPAAALDHMLDDARPKVVLDDPEAVAEAVAGRPASRPPALGSRPDDPAYVVYTSGSTGRPKGVVVPQRALAGYSAAVIERYGLGPGDRALQFASLSFDVSVEEIVPTLLAGAEVVLRSDEMAESHEELLAATARDGLTVLNLPSAFWHDLVRHLDEHPGAAVPPSVRLVVVGGEKASRHAYDRWQALVPGVRWLNGYGPTEATVTCAVFEAGSVDAVEGEVPIGRPLANSRAYVLGPRRRLLPPGVAGELWIGGSGVATGYLGRDDLTADGFHPDPFSSEPGARMYRTGDLARWLPSGDLEFLGRADRQVKLRGHRIEPGEVEAALERHPAVAQAFVAVRGAPARLVAWVVGEGPDPVALLAHLRASLPRHLVPSAVVPVVDLPRTPGGKVDVDALPLPAGGDPLDGDAAADPAPPLAGAIAARFGEVLGTPPVRPDDSFFELGGDSLLAIRLLARLRRDAAGPLSLATLHAAPTPRLLALTLAGPDGLAGPRYLVPIQRGGDRLPLFGVHVLGPGGQFFRPLAEALGADQPVLGLGFVTLDDETPTDIVEIARRYADEVARSYPSGPVALAAVSLGGYVAFELAQQLAAAGREVALLAVFDGAGPGGRPMVRGAARVRTHLGLLRRHGLGYVAAKAKGVVEEARLRVASARLRRHTARGRPVPSDLRARAFVAANVEVIDDYVARPYPGRITVFHAADGSFDTPEAVAAALGWSVVAGGGVDVVDVPGDHMTMLEPPNVSTLATHLAARLPRFG